MKIEGLHPIRKQTNRELHSINDHHGEQANEERKRRSARTDGSGKPIRESGPGLFRLESTHDEPLSP